MKKNICIALAAAAMMGFTACSEDTFDDINKDTYHPAPDVVPAYLQLSEAIMNTGFSTVSGDLAFYLSSLNEQNVGVGNNQLMKAELRNSNEWANSSTFNNVWSSTYGNLLNIQQMIDKVENNVSGNEGQYDILGIAQVLKVMEFGILTDMFGDIPYSEALKGQQFLQPKLDSQKDIYVDLLKTLDDAIKNLQTATDEDLNNVKDQDLVFAGDMEKWLAAAYGLKARYLMHQSAVDSKMIAEAGKAAAEALRLGFESMTIKEFNGVTCDNPWFAFIYSRAYIAASATVGKMMKANNDPRLACYTSNDEAILVEPGDRESSMVMDGSLGYPAWYQGSLPIHLLSKAEVCFILAESQLRQGLDATTAFKDAVTSSVSEVLTLMGDKNAQSVAENFAASLGTPTLKTLFEQKYLAQSIDEQVETYNDIRRCEAMGEHYIQFTNPNNVQAGKNRVPKRLPYGNDSVINNPKMAEAYGDGFYIYDEPVWWAGGKR